MTTRVTTCGKKDGQYAQKILRCLARPLAQIVPALDWHDECRTARGSIGRERGKAAAAITAPWLLLLG